MNTLGIFVALSAALMHAVLQIILRYLGRYESPETITFYFFIIGTLLTALPLPFIAVRPTLAEIPLLLGVGLAGAGGPVAAVHRLSQCTRRHRYGLQLQQHRLGDTFWLDDLERMAGSRRYDRRCHCDCFEYPDDLARKPAEKNFRCPVPREVMNAPGNLRVNPPGRQYLQCRSEK